MIGIYRFLLAQTVVLCHMGGFAPNLSHLAVYSFYMVSGFLIMRVLDTRYLAKGITPRGIGTFYANRVLKIFPLFAVLAIASMGLKFMHPAPFLGLEIIPPLNERFAWSSAFFFIPDLVWWQSIPVLVFGRLYIITQVWTVGVELCWYLLAPLALLLTRRYPIALPALFIAALLYSLFTLCSLQAASLSAPLPEGAYANYFYKSLHAGLPLFLGGALIYRMRIRIRVPAFLTLALLLGYFFYLLFESHGLLADQTILKLVVSWLLVACVTFIVISARPEGWLARVNHKLGELSYGIYLNQYITVFLMLWLSEYMGLVFGAPNRLSFGLWAVLFCTVLAHFTYHLVETPVERIRSKLRR